MSWSTRAAVRTGWRTPGTCARRASGRAGYFDSGDRLPDPTTRVAEVAALAEDTHWLVSVTFRYESVSTDST